MVMNENSVDKFLLANKVEIADNGFTERVMQSLPFQEQRAQRLNWMWNVIFAVALVAFCWYTDVLGKLMVDIEVYIHNMPLHLFDIQWWYGLATIAIGLFALVIFGGKKLIYD